MLNNNWEQTEVQKNELNRKLSEITNILVKVKKTGEQVMEEIRETYVSHFAPNELYNLTLTHKGNWKEILEGAFITGELDIDVEQKPIKIDSTFKESNIYRYDNMTDLQKRYYKEMGGEAGKYFPNGIDMINVSFPIGKTSFKESFPKIKAIALQLRLLNPQMTVQDVNDYLIHLFITYVSNRKDFYISGYKNFSYVSEELEKMAGIIHKTPIDKIRPNTKKVSIIWNPDYDLTPEERNTESNVLIGNYRTDKTTKQLRKLYFDLGKPTQKTLAVKSGKGIATIKRHWGNITQAA